MYRVQPEKRNPDSPSRKGPSGVTVQLRPPAFLVAANDPRLSSSLAGERESVLRRNSICRMAVMKRRWLWREIGGGGSLSVFILLICWRVIVSKKEEVNVL
ncbi:hypothetical protein CEXT_42271 [Caerostris extrusa]|uniref:Uncharacterized protein n=1 Tax=Caerostris extrusa TaxID=172846 RepID=A0AAV4PWX0_CAEEX|nr:hypothetical protein CEXT_42271 [Caerostris extrusa]